MIITIAMTLLERERNAAKQDNTKKEKTHTCARIVGQHAAGVDRTHPAFDGITRECVVKLVWIRKDEVIVLFDPCE